MLTKLETELKLRGFSQKTVEVYMIHNQKFLRYTNKDPNDVVEDDVKEYMAYLMSERNQKPASVGLVLSALRFFYEKILKKDILKDIKHPKVGEKLPVVFSKNDVLKLLGSIKNDKHRLIIEVMFSSGLRVSECVSLKKQNIDFENNSLMVQSGKGSKDRLTILSKKTAARLQEYFLKYPNESVYLFPNKQGGHVSVKLAQKIIKKAAEDAGLKKNIFCHALRSSFATQLLENGTDIRIIQALLGHKHLSTTQIYTHVSTEQIRKVKSPLDDL